MKKYLMKLSIIIPTLNGWEITSRCLGTIWASQLPKKYEVLVVDDGSTDLTKDTDKIVGWPEVRFIHMEKNGGFPVACNEGIRQAKGRYITIFNNDLFVPRHWWWTLETLIAKEYATCANEGGVFTAKVGMAAGRLCQPCTCTEDVYWTIPPYSWGDGVIWMQIGFPWVFKRQLFDEIGLFDEQFVPGYFEESDLWMRMAHAGWVFCMTDRVVSYHMQGATMNREFGDNGVADMCMRNEKRFIDKWGAGPFDLGKIVKEANAGPSY
jgi:GT2 family glycosyltransferase